MRRGACARRRCIGAPRQVHFQLSLLEPPTHDMPGVVSDSQHAEALRTYPDPRDVLGVLYEGDGLFEAGCSSGGGKDVEVKRVAESA